MNGQPRRAIASQFAVCVILVAFGVMSALFAQVLTQEKKDQQKKEEFEKCGKPPHPDCICLRMLYDHLGEKAGHQIVAEKKAAGWQQHRSVTPGKPYSEYRIWLCPPEVEYTVPRNPAPTETPKENPNPLGKILQGVSIGVGVSGGHTGGRDDRKGDHHLDDKRRVDDHARSTSSDSRRIEDQKKATEHKRATDKSKSATPTPTPTHRG
jgi:hypothetical protein